MNTKPSFKFSSHLLISTLIASSFLMVNCNKGGTRAGVKSKTVADKQDPNKKGTSANEKQCSAEVLKVYAPLAKEHDQVKKLHDKKIADKTNEKLKSEYNKVLAACDVLGAAFDKEKLTECALASKDILTKVPTQCTNVAVYLFKEDGTKTPYLKLANDQAVNAKKQREQKIFEDFKNEKLLISEEMKAMLKPENLDFKMYIVDGVIKSNQDEMTKAYQDKKVVCSFAGTSTPVVEKEKVFLNLGENVIVDKVETTDSVIINGIGLSMTISTEKASDTSGGYITLACSHLLKDKIDVKLLKKALGKHLAVETKESAAAKDEPVVATKVSPDGTAAKTKDAKSDFRKSEIIEMNLTSK